MKILLIPTSLSPSFFLIYLWGVPFILQCLNSCLALSPVFSFEGGGRNVHGRNWTESCCLRSYVWNGFSTQQSWCQGTNILLLLKIWWSIYFVASCIHVPFAESWQVTLHWLNWIVPKSQSYEKGSDYHYFSTVHRFTSWLMPMWFYFPSLTCHALWEGTDRCERF